MGAFTVEAYVAAQLLEVEEALDELDRRPDAIDAHDARRQLVDLQRQLLAALATFASPPASMN